MKTLAWSLALFLALSAPSMAGEPPNLPGRAPPVVTKTLVFLISSTVSGANIEGAEVACDHRGTRRTRRTDWRGTAPLRFTFRRIPIGAPNRLDCIVTKYGYQPARMNFDLAREPASRLVPVDLTPRRARALSMQEGETVVSPDGIEPSTY